LLETESSSADFGLDVEDADIGGHDDYAAAQAG
jgi:hypothetical protein